MCVIYPVVFFFFFATPPLAPFISHIFLSFSLVPFFRKMEMKKIKINCFFCLLCRTLCRCCCWSSATALSLLVALLLVVVVVRTTQASPNNNATERKYPSKEVNSILPFISLFSLSLSLTQLILYPRW